MYLHVGSLSPNASIVFLNCILINCLIEPVHNLIKLIFDVQPAGASGIERGNMLWDLVNYLSTTRAFCLIGNVLSEHTLVTADMTAARNIIQVKYN